MARRRKVTNTNVTVGQLAELLKNIENALFEIANNLKAFNDAWSPTDPSAIAGTISEAFFDRGGRVPPVNSGQCGETQ